MSSISALSASTSAWPTTATQRPSGPPPGGGPEKTNAAVADLAKAAGVSTDDLLARLTDGTGIQDLLDSNPDVAARLSSNQKKGALVDGYA